MQFQHISRAMSKALRHDPEWLGIKLDEEGWTDATALFHALLKQFPNMKGFTWERFEEIIQHNDKKRFSFSEDGRRIRANQGHSVNVDLKLLPQEPPFILYHGTASKTVPSVVKRGLMKMNRQHVHLSRDVETALKVGQRHGKPSVFLVSAKMHQKKTGQEYFLSDNGVWLTDHVPPEYLIEMSGDLANQLVQEGVDEEEKTRLIQEQYVFLKEVLE